LRRGLTPVYLDETGFEPDAPRTHGWSRKGQRVYGTKSGNRRPRQSLLLAQCGPALLAPFLFAGTCDSGLFNTWLQEVLLPELPPASLVIMDNAAFHKHPATRTILAAAGHTLLYLPPYSPDFNPIEQTFSRLKALRRKLQLEPFSLLSEII
jgi:transposase